MSEGLRRLPGPYEYLNLPDGGSVRLRIVTWERGSAEIYSKVPPPASLKEIPVLRVHVWPGYKEFAPMYYDLASKTLIAQLLPMLMERGFENIVYVITKHGRAPKARYTVTREPL